MSAYAKKSSQKSFFEKTGLTRKRDAIFSCCARINKGLCRTPNRSKWLNNQLDYKWENFEDKKEEHESHLSQSFDFLEGTNAVSISRILIFVVILGVVIGCFTMAFIYLEKFIEQYFNDMSETIAPGSAEYRYAHWILGATVSSGFIGFITKKYIPECQGAGADAAKICLAVSAPIPLTVAFFRVILSSTYLAFGNPLGIEAPTLHVAAAIASFMLRVASKILPEDFRLEHLPTWVLVGMTTGLASAFKSPLAGMMYAIEEYMNVRRIGQSVVLIAVGATVGVVFATGIRDYFIELWINIGLPRESVEQRLLLVKFNRIGAFYHILFSFLIAIIAALLAQAVTQITLTLRKFTSNELSKILPRYLHGCLSGFLVGLIGVIIKILCDTKIMGIGTSEYYRVLAIPSCQEELSGFKRLTRESEQNKFYHLDFAYLTDPTNEFFDPDFREVQDKEYFSDQHHCVRVTEHLGFLIGKILVVCIAISAGGPGGIYFPSLLMGAALGSVIASVMSMIVPELADQWHIAIMLGMVGLFSALLRTPMTAILVAYEMSGYGGVGLDNSLTFSMITTSVVAHLISSSLDPIDLISHIMIQDGVDSKLLFQKGLAAFTEEAGEAGEGGERGKPVRQGPPEFEIVEKKNCITVRKNGEMTRFGTGTELKRNSIDPINLLKTTNMNDTENENNDEDNLSVYSIASRRSNGTAISTIDRTRDPQSRKERELDKLNKSHNSGDVGDILSQRRRSNVVSNGPLGAMDARAERQKARERNLDGGDNDPNVSARLSARQKGGRRGSLSAGQKQAEVRARRQSMIQEINPSKDKKSNKNKEARRHSLLAGNDEVMEEDAITINGDVDEKKEVKKDNNKKLELESKVGGTKKKHKEKQENLTSAAAVILLSAAKRAITDQQYSDNVWLHLLAKRNNVTGMHEHLNKGARVDLNWEHPGTGETVLFVAIENKLQNACRMLLHKQADPSFCCRKANGSPPLLTACKHGLGEAAAALIAHGSSIKVKDPITGNRPIHLAAASGSINLMKILLEFNASFKAVNKAGQYPMLIAASNHHHSVISMLMSESWKSVSETDENQVFFQKYCIKNERGKPGMSSVHRFDDVAGVESGGNRVMEVKEKKGRHSILRLGTSNRTSDFSFLLCPPESRQNSKESVDNHMDFEQTKPNDPKALDVGLTDEVVNRFVRFDQHFMEELDWDWGVAVKKIKAKNARDFDTTLSRNGIDKNKVAIAIPFSRLWKFHINLQAALFLGPNSTLVRHTSVIEVQLQISIVGTKYVLMEYVPRDKHYRYINMVVGLPDHSSYVESANMALCHNLGVTPQWLGEHLKRIQYEVFSDEPPRRNEKVQTIFHVQSLAFMILPSSLQTNSAATIGLPAGEPFIKSGKCWRWMPAEKADQYFEWGDF